MVTFTGDLYLGDVTIDFSDLQSLKIFSSGYVVSNFENVLRNDLLSKRIDKSSNLQFSRESFESYLKILKSKSVFTLGNNHFHDLGEDGLLDTIAFLESYQNIYFTGIGYFNEVIEPHIIEVNSKKIALLCVSTDEPEVMSVLATKEKRGVLDYNDCIIIDIIKEYKKLVDFIVIMPHWGKEFVDYPSVQQRQKAYKWIDAGADLIIGHHPHVIQGKENYRGKWIYYSLGNYIFPNFFDKNGIQHKWHSENNKSVMLQVDFSEILTVSEIGLFFDSSINKLTINNSSISNLNKKSKALEVDDFPLKKYYGIWQKDLFRVLRKDYSIAKNLISLFPRHKNYSRFGYFGYRLFKKIIK